MTEFKVGDRVNYTSSKRIGTVQEIQEDGRLLLKTDRVPKVSIEAAVVVSPDKCRKLIHENKGKVIND